MEHEIKLRREFADAVLNGEKTFEIRNNDRGYQKGDTIRFRVIDAYEIQVNHPICFERFEITYVLNGWGLKDNYVALAIKKVDKRKE